MISSFLAINCYGEMLVLRNSLQKMRELALRGSTLVSNVAPAGKVVGNP